MKNTLGLVGRKIGMTRIFGADGSVTPDYGDRKSVV